LNNQQETLTLIQWEPELIFDVKRFLLRLMKQKSQLKDGIKVNLPEQIDLLQHELMQLDPARALNAM
jgi:type VI secretion system protein VasJ